MFEENPKPERESQTTRLVNKFNESLEDDLSIFLDSHEIDLIIDYFVENNNKYKLKEAFNLYEKLYPFSPILKIKKAQALLYFNKPLEAFAELENVPLRDSEEFLFVKANIYSKLNQTKKAIAIYEKLLLTDKNNEEVISCLASEYQKNDELSKSVDMLERLLEMKNYNEVNWFSYIVTCEISKKLKRALNFMKRHIEINPYDYEAWFYLGIVYQRMNNHLDALEAFDYSICIKEDFIRVYSNKAESLSELGYYQRAIDCCKDSFKFQEPDCMLYYDIGELYEKLDDLEKAKKYFYKSIKKDDTYAESWYTLALILDLQGSYLEASYHIKKAVDLRDSNIDYLFTYAKIHERIGFLKEAEMAYRKVLELDELDSESWLNYSYLIFKNESVSEAIDIIKNGIKHNPDNAEMFYRLSAYLFQCDSEKDALSNFEKALQLDYDFHEEFFQHFPSIKDNKNLLHLLTKYKK